MSLTFKQENHEYFYNDLWVPSGSYIINDNFPGSILPQSNLVQRACDFGTAFHQLTKLYDEGKLDYGFIDQGLEGYFEQYRKFKNDWIQQYLEIELPRYSKRHNFASTPDRLAVLKNGKVAVPDFKSTKNHNIFYRLKSAGYKLLTEAEERFCVMFDEKSYEIIPHKDRGDELAFISACNLTNWRINQKLSKRREQCKT